MVSTAAPRPIDRNVYFTVLVAALGYFVDIYDLILFSIVRVKSLKSIGVSDAELLDRGVLLINLQMSGMLIGGVLWGILGDKRGRLSVLFGSILLYSIANIANGFVTDVGTYGALRVIAGIGLAGELGAGITLVSELLPTRVRGYGTTIVAGVGVMGAVFAALVGDTFDWRVAYFVGGGLGLGLLVLRIGVYESSMFKDVKEKGVRRGAFFSLFADFTRARRYLSVILIGVPIWFVIGVLVTFSPEIGKAMGMTEIPAPAKAVLYCYSGLAVGDILSGLISQILKSRKKVVLGSILFTAAAMALYFTVGKSSLGIFYVLCFALGIGGGYWALFVTMASELFGTNIRATVTTTAPNFVRGALVLLTLLFQALKPALGVPGSAIAVGALAISLALAALIGLEETFSRELDFLEE
ncbi:MAG: MFS transporter [Myxococcota bacterium]